MNAIPSDSKPTLKLGFDYFSEHLRCKLYFNLQSYLIEKSCTYLFNPTVALGGNIIFNPKTTALEKYDFGVNSQLASGSNFGIKHESTSKDAIKLGKFFFYFFHNASAYQTIGTEFSIDYQNRASEARLAFLHKFDENVISKFKINHLGHIDALLKYKLSETTTVNVTTGMNVRNFSEQKVRGIPLGVSFDVKF